MRFRHGPKKSYMRRLWETILSFGIPMIALELVFIPIKYWAIGLFFLIPSVLIGSVFAALTEYGIIDLIGRSIEKRKDDSSK